MTDHWCKYCNGVNTHNCQFNPNLPRMKIYTTNTAVVSDNEALLRQALEALESYYVPTIDARGQLHRRTLAWRLQ